MRPPSTCAGPSTVFTWCSTRNGTANRTDAAISATRSGAVPCAAVRRRLARLGAGSRQRDSCAACSRSLCFMTLPVALRGSSATNQSAARALVVGEALGAERGERRRRRASTPGLRTTNAPTSSPSTWCGTPIDRGFLHVGVLEDHGLDVGGVDVVAAADDHVLDAAGDVDEAVVVEVREVAGAQPAVVGPRGRARAVVLVVLAPLARAGARAARRPRSAARSSSVSGSTTFTSIGGIGLPTEPMRFARLFLRHRDERGPGLGEPVGVDHRRLRHPVLQLRQRRRRERRAADRHRDRRREVGAPRSAGSR